MPHCVPQKSEEPERISAQALQLPCFRLSLIGPSFPRHTSELRKGGFGMKSPPPPRGNAITFSMFQLEPDVSFDKRKAEYPALPQSMRLGTVAQASEPSANLIRCCRR